MRFQSALNWKVKRLLQAVLTFVVVVNLTFFMIRGLPGGPMDYLRSQLYGQGGSISQARLEAISEAYLNVNPSQPLKDQYISYMYSLLVEFDLGQSIWYEEPVRDILVNAIPWTVFVMTIGLSISFTFGISLGAIMAYFESGKFDSAMTVYSVTSSSLPYYIVAVLLLYFLGYIQGWFPTGGLYNTRETTPSLSLEFFISAFYHALLPALSIILTWTGSWALSMRGNSIRILGEDYVRVAKLRGLSSYRIAFLYIGKNAILPLYTQLLISIGVVFGGSVILETVFNYRGLGYFMFEGINARDYPLMMGSFLVITSAIIVGVLIADLTYGYIDPRIQGGEQDGEVY